MWRDLWTYRRRTVIGAVSVFGALLAVAVVLAVAAGGSGGHRTARATPSLPTTTDGTPSPGLTGYDRGPWNAAPSPIPAVSEPYPAIDAADRTQPDAFARAFGVELLARDYRHSTRDQLLGWAQASSAPLTIVQVPLTDADRAKALVTSLVTPGWDAGEIGTPVPSQGEWLAWRARQAYTTVSDVAVTTVADFPPADTTFTQPTLDRAVTAIVTVHSMVSGKPAAARLSVAFEIVMTNHSGSFGAAEVQHWATKDMS